jgi:hypothetical protein
MSSYTSPEYYTFGNSHNSYTSDVREDFKVTLDYIFYRPPDKDAPFTVKVKDFRYLTGVKKHKNLNLKIVVLILEFHIF